MISILKETLKNHTLCEIYANTERTDKFFVGYVISIDEQNCVLSAIDPYGQYDGLACFCIDEKSIEFKQNAVFASNGKTGEL